MTKVSRIALAVPFVLAAAAPAAASNLFWDFSQTWTVGGDTFTLRGTTEGLSGSTGPGPFNVANNLRFSINGGPQQSVFLWVGDVVRSNGEVGNTRSGEVVVTGLSAGSSGWSWPVSGPAALPFTGGSFTWSTTAFNTTLDGFENDNDLRVQRSYSLTGGDNGAFFVSDALRFRDGAWLPSMGSGDGSGDAVRISAASGIKTEAALVPEINGSSFAYIAFILGALGLWLYSGAARGRPEETSAAA